MDRIARLFYNTNFSKDKYSDFLKSLGTKYPGAVEFRVAETPVFIDINCTNKMLSACEHIINLIQSPSFRDKTNKAIPDNLYVPNDDYTNPHFMAFDFGICMNEKGEPEPQLVEMQGFASLFAFQLLLDDLYRTHFIIPSNYSAFLNGFDTNSYIDLLKKIILGKYSKEHVVLLELFPHQQKTRIDFYYTKELLGIEIVCLTEIIQEGKDLFYLKEGKKIQINRIYNRIIFDELLQQPQPIQEKASFFFKEMNVEWVTHPNWFYRISKYTLPFIDHPFVPKTFFLKDIQHIPSDLNNYVLKPLFSFAGKGVIIDVTKDDIDKIKDTENWIIQHKVQYADIIQTPEMPAKAEVRIFYFWEDGKAHPVAAFNLARISKGKMIGTQYNKGEEWVGGTIAYFEKKLSY